QIACKDEHCGNEWMPYQKAQPDTGHFWMKLQETTHGQVPKVNIEYRPYMCQQCDDPKCAVCDAVIKRPDGLVTIDPVKAKGRKDIMEACPYGAIYWNEELDIPQKCDGCAHLIDAGEVPHCVELCATGAIKFGEEAEFTEEIARATQIIPEEGCRPRVYYLNAPGLFIGGDVWNSEDNEVIIGARVELTYPDGTKQMTTTDDFGDFWFRRLPAGKYGIAIFADGYAVGSKNDIDLVKSLNLGDFDLAKA
ncbi:MAG: 4Fe-4S dicluster domain-containing protein, partial [Raoultibacter sp.]